jgi:hypothetical protein
MSALSIQPTYPIFTDIDGQPLENGYIWIGAANLDPQTNPINVYWDAALTIQAVQPIRTLAGYPSRSGTPARLYVNSDYSIRVQNRNGSMVYSAPTATERYSEVVFNANASQVIYNPAGTGAVPTNVQAVLRRTVWVEDFLPANFNYSTGDAITYIQAAINSGANQINFAENEYRISAPIQIPGGIHLVGKGASATAIKKTTTTVGTGSNTARGGTITDSYAKNAIIIFTHPDNGYNYDSSIRGINLVSDGYIVEYGIFAPRMSQFWLQDVQIYQCRYGWVAYDAWLTEFDKVVVNANTQHGINGGPTYGWVGDTYGIWWANDGAGSGTGTSLNANNCWTRDCDYGWYLYGLSYSNLNGCAADNISQSAYTFQLSRLSLNGCGFENVQSNSSAVACEFANVVFNSCDTFQIFGGVAGTTAMLKVDGGSVVLNSCRWANFAVVNAAYNLIIQSGAKVINNGSLLPTNGNSFVSYNSGSQYINNNSVPPFVISEASGANSRYQMGRVRDNEVQEKTNKSIAAGGTVIATLTSGSSLNFGVCEFTVSWYDSSYPTGAGISKFLVAVHKDASTYRENVSSVTSAYATNGGAGAPTYTLSRVGDVWSLTMTPQDGACTAFTITAEMQNISGITLALP